MSENKRRPTILIHSADRDLSTSLAILLQDEHEIIRTETVAQLVKERTNLQTSILVVDLEKSVEELLEEFEIRRAMQDSTPLIVLYAFRQTKPEWEKSIRRLANQVLYKPVPIDEILNAIALEKQLRLKS